MIAELFRIFLSASWPFILLGAGIRWWVRKNPDARTITMLTFLSPGTGLVLLFPRWGGSGISDEFFLLLCGLPVGAILCGLVLRGYEAVQKYMDNDHL